LLYGSIVTAARRPAFYANWGVPDTMQGRFEMIVLHLALAVRRLGSAGDAGKRLAQALIEAFVIDMDDAMRELTFGDLAVPREIKRATAAVFDRHKAYLAALDGSHDMLQESIGTQLAYLGSSGLDAGGVAGYMRRAVEMLDRQPDAEVLTGEMVWPDPVEGQET
jgi:cytochrome b pre-mRNA-processing protein 3